MCACGACEGRVSLASEKKTWLDSMSLAPLSWCGRATVRFGSVREREREGKRGTSGLECLVGMLISVMVMVMVVVVVLMKGIPSYQMHTP